MGLMLCLSGNNCFRSVKEINLFLKKYVIIFMFIIFADPVEALLETVERLGPVTSTHPEGLAVRPYQQLPQQDGPRGGGTLPHSPRQGGHHHRLHAHVNHDVRHQRLSQEIRYVGSYIPRLK